MESVGSLSRFSALKGVGLNRQLALKLMTFNPSLYHRMFRVQLNKSHNYKSYGKEKPQSSRQSDERNLSGHQTHVEIKDKA